MLSIVVAAAENNIIGRDNNLIWKIPHDLERFKNITMTGSRTIIMGRKTFDSINRILPGRKHIVLTRNKAFNADDENLQVVHSLEELNPYIEAPLEYFVIGGGEIFSLLLPYVKKIYLTRVHKEFSGDTYFPQLNMKEWRITSCLEEKTNESCRYDTSFMILERI